MGATTQDSPPPVRDTHLRGSPHWLWSWERHLGTFAPLLCHPSPAQEVSMAKEARLEAALNSISKKPPNLVNLKEIARKHDIPYTTLQRLTPEQEEKIVDWAIYLSLRAQPTNKYMLNQKLCEIYPPWAKIEGPSKKWWNGFFKRNPKIRLRKASGIPAKRAQSFNFTAVNGTFKLIDTAMKEHNIPWRLVLNPREVPNTTKLQSDNLQLVTVIECVTAEGVALDPGFIFPGESHFNSWYNVPGFESSRHM